MLRPFDYYRPKGLAEAQALLKQEPSAAVLAGGTDVVVKLRRGSVQPPMVVDIKGLEELRGISWQDGRLSLGALTTFNDLLQLPEVNQHFAVLIDAARVMGCREIRHRATLGGNVANASPGAESGSPLAALAAEVVLAGPEGSRRMAIGDFWQGVGKTALTPGELLTHIDIPALPPGSKSAYMRRSRVLGMDLASVNVAVVVIDPERAARRQIRVAMGAVAPTPIRAVQTEQLLGGQDLTPALYSRMRETIQKGIEPRATSLRATPEYKKQMVGVMTQMILEGLLSK